MPANKAILVTGGARRLGRAIALDLAAQGWNVAIQYRSSSKEAEEVRALAENTGIRATTIAADLSDTSACQRVIEEAGAAIGPLTGLVCAAANFEPDEIGHMTEASFNASIFVNLRAPVFLAQAFAAQLPENLAGSIVNLVDQRVLKPNPYFFSYALSKSALWMATETLAQSLAPRIRVNAVAPGPSLQNQRQTQADFQRQVDNTLLKRPSAPEEIAAAVRYLIEANAVTGQMITVDSGQHLNWHTPDVLGVQE